LFFPETLKKFLHSQHALVQCVLNAEVFIILKTVRVAVFAEGPAAEEAKAAGADVVGGDELIEEIRKGTSSPSVDVGAPLLCCDFRNLFCLEISPIATYSHSSTAS
jgi:hypothetical protein